MLCRRQVWFTRQHHRSTSSFRGELPAHSPLINGMRDPCPPAHTHFHSRIQRSFARSAGHGRRQRSHHTSTLDFYTLYAFSFIFNGFAHACSCMLAHHPRCNRTLFLYRARSKHVHVAARAHAASVVMEAGERSQEDQRSHVSEKRRVWKKILLD